MFRRISTFCESIKISHSVFALPFAVAAAFLASSGLPPGLLLIKIILAVVFARTSAMAFNRWCDARIDALNPRTENRAVVTGELTGRFMLGAAICSSLAFVAVAATINPLALILSPVALGILLGYSYTKRFTPLSHVVLGVALGLSPLGAWIAVRGEFALVPTLLGLAVLLWTAGFDIIYACQDEAFDRQHGLFSIPQTLGVGAALWVTRVFHLIAVALLAIVGWQAQLGVIYASGVAMVAIILAYENSLVRAEDLSRVNLAFFTLNGIVSLVFMAAVILQIVL